MAESGVILPADSTGKALRTESATTTFTTGSGGVVHQQVVTLADSAGTLLGTAAAPVPTGIVQGSTQATVKAAGVPSAGDNALIVGLHPLGSLPSGSNVIGTVNLANLPVLTKGTQGTTGVSTQDLKDAGRTTVVLSATSIASVTTVALFSLNIWQAGAVTSATSYTVPAGKSFRVQSIQFGARFATPSTTVTFASARFDVRAITSGAIATSSALVYGDTKMAASNVATPNSDLPVPDGMEFPAGYVIGVTHVDSATTLLLDVVIVGYTY